MAVHWRRGDFVFARRADVVKPAEVVAATIRREMAARGIEWLFVSTGANPDAHHHFRAASAGHHFLLENEGARCFLRIFIFE
eukprot:SAG31_NODE_4609_length_3098_cov_2.056019_3_plen_82_part_00